MLRRRLSVLLVHCRRMSTLPPTHNLLLRLQNERRRTKKKKKKERQSPRTRPIQANPSLLRPRLESALTLESTLRPLLRALFHLHSLPSPSLPLPLPTPLRRHLAVPATRLTLLHPLLLSLRSPPGHLSLTPLALSLLRLRRRLALSSLPLRAPAVAKLLMLSRHHRLPLAKLHHCRHLLGLPDDFRDHVPRFAHLFRLARSSPVPTLELADWHPSLAVSRLERDFLSDEPRVRGLFHFPVPHAASLHLPEPDRARLRDVSTLPLVSPYSDGWRLDPWTVEAEKFRVGVVHEFLWLTVEKRAWIHHIVEFKEEFCLTRRTYDMLRRQPRAFCLAGTEMNWAVFLREAYGEDGELKEKDDPMLEFYQKLRKYALMSEEEYRNGRELEDDDAG